MTSSNKISGKIINYNDSYSGEIIFDENIISINKIEDKNSQNYIIPGFVDLHCHGGGGFDTMEGVQAIQKMSSYHLSKGTTSLLATTWTSSFKHTYVLGLSSLFSSSTGEFSSSFSSDSSSELFAFSWVISVS